MFTGIIEETGRVERIVAGLEVPDQGEVWLKDTLVSAPHRLVVSPVERRLGMVFQDLAPFNGGSRCRLCAQASS